MKRSFLYILSALIVLTVMQLIFGNVSPDFFRFPLNLLLALLWTIIIWKEKSATKWRFLKTISSPKFSIAIIATSVLSLLVLGLVKQDDEISDSFGFHNFTTSLIFVGILFLLITNLISITIDYMKSKKSNKLRFFLIHFGLICTLSAGFWGSSDQKVYRIMAQKDKEASEMFDSKGNIYKPDYSIRLLDLNKQYYSNGIIAKCCGSFLIDNNKTDIEVNSPYSKSLFEDIYMVSYDTESSDYCVLEIVRQPWKYLMLFGIIMTIIGAFLLFINGPTNRKGERK